MLLNSFCRTLLRSNISNAIRIAEKQVFVTSVIQPAKYFSLGTINRCEKSKEEDVSVKDASKDRTKVIPVETSVRYLESSAYAETYGSEPVWKLYRRNHKGARPPAKTRKTCIREGKISTGNPCPICRDEYLVLHPENVKLLKQFISPFTGGTLSYSVTGVCQKRHRELLIALEIAKDKGLIEFDVPFREYDYSLYQSS